MADSIAKQSKIAHEISENIKQISIGVNEVNENVSLSSCVSENVAKEIPDVLSASQQIDDFISNIKKKAGVLNNIIFDFEALSERFTI